MDIDWLARRLTLVTTGVLLVVGALALALGGVL